MIKPPLVISVACLAIALGGCGTTLATRNEASSNDVSAAPAATSPSASTETNFGSATIPDFGPQLPGKP
jgi:hypothetical protein